MEVMLISLFKYRIDNKCSGLSLQLLATDVFNHKELWLGKTKESFKEYKSRYKDKLLPVVWR